MVAAMLAAETTVAPSPPDNNADPALLKEEDTKNPSFRTQTSSVVFGSTHSTVARLDLTCGKEDDLSLLCDDEQEQQVKALMDEIFVDSDLFTRGDVKLNDLPRFEISEIQAERFLGKGEFGLVHEVEKVAMDDASSRKSDSEKDPAQGSEAENGYGFDDYASARLTRSFVASHVIRPRCGSARYAIKTLNEEPPHDGVSQMTHTLQAIVDLSNEAHFLSEIHHPHIIKIRGMSEAITPSVGSRAFILLDRIYDTLTQRIGGEWAKRDKKNRNIVTRMRGRTLERSNELTLERYYAMHEITSAVEHLHSRNILHRDLKPDNIGFDVRGDAKIFDFGLAREIKQSDLVQRGSKKDLPEVYRLTGVCGSFPYMAPEVYADEPYNKAVDVYALAFLSWQIMSLSTKPFRKEIKAGQDVAKLVYGVTAGRPSLDSKKWPKPIKKMIQSAWASRMDNRPTASYVNEVIRNEIQRNGGMRDSSLDRTGRSMMCAET